MYEDWIVKNIADYELCNYLNTFKSWKGRKGTYKQGEPIRSCCL